MCQFNFGNVLLTVKLGDLVSAQIRRHPILKVHRDPHFLQLQPQLRLPLFGRSPLSLLLSPLLLQAKIQNFC